MTVNEYLNNYTLLTDLPPTIDYDLIKNRFIAIYGSRKIRGDVPIGNIAKMAQTVYNVNQSLLLPLFTNNINPLQTWAEKGDDSNAEKGSNSGTNTDTTTGSSTTDANNTTTTSSSGADVVDKNETTTTGSSNSNTQNSVHAFNSVDVANPTDSSMTTATANSTNSNTAKTTATANSTNTNTTNSTTTDSSTTTAENSSTHDITRDGNYNKSGYNISDYERAFNAFVAPYDYLIRLIANDICVTTFDLFDGMGGMW